MEFTYTIEDDSNDVDDIFKVAFKLEFLAETSHSIPAIDFNATNVSNVIYGNSMPDIKIIMFEFQKASNMKSYVMALCEYFEIL